MFGSYRSDCMSSGYNSDRVTFQMKLLQLGDSGVGKTSFSQQYINEVVQLHEKKTFGFEIYEKILPFNIKDEKVNINLVLWDTAGMIIIYLIF